MANLIDFYRTVNSWLGYRSEFYSFETYIIEELKSRLDAGVANQLQRQVEVINKVQRDSGGKEVIFYQMRHGKPSFDDSLRFPYANDEELLATIRLTRPDTKAKLKVDVWLVKGRLFSLAFNKSPDKYFAGMNLMMVQPVIDEVKIWINPLHPHPVYADKPIDGSTLTGWLRDWYTEGRVTCLHAPFLQPELTAYLDRIDAQLPLDYLELVVQTEGAKLVGCEIYGVAGIRQSVDADANYYVLADIEGLGALAVKEGARNAELYLLHYEDGDTRTVGTSFKKAIEDLSVLKK